MSNEQAIRRHRKVDGQHATYCPVCRQSWPCDPWQAMTGKDCE